MLEIKSRHLTWGGPYSVLSCKPLMMILFRIFKCKGLCELGTKTELLCGWNTKELALIPYEKLNLARSNMTHFKWDLKRLWNFLIYSRGVLRDVWCILFRRSFATLGPSGHSTPRPPFYGRLLSSPCIAAVWHTHTLGPL